MFIYLGARAVFKSVMLVSIGKGFVYDHGIGQQHGGPRAFIGSVSLVVALASATVAPASTLAAPAFESVAPAFASAALAFVSAATASA
jgi:hypothetical protein